MARIPMGNFGNAMPEVQRIAVPQNNLDQLGSAIANAGSSVHGAFQEIDKQKQEAEKYLTELFENPLAYIPASDLCNSPQRYPFSCRNCCNRLLFLNCRWSAPTRSALPCNNENAQSPRMKHSGRIQLKG